MYSILCTSRSKIYSLKQDVCRLSSSCRVVAFIAVLTLLFLYYEHSADFSPSSKGSDSRPELEINPEVIASHLSNLCAQTNWTEGLWLHCHSYCGENKTSICGGLNNARNRFQTCLRLAIDAGAGIIIPSATTRDEKHLVDTDVLTVCPETFWNIEHLSSTLGQQCPQMKIRSCDDRRGLLNEIAMPVRHYLAAPHTNGTFKHLVESSFQGSNFTLAEVSAKNPVVVTYGDSYIGWNYDVARELSTIRPALFKALRFNPKLLDMSARILGSPELNGGNFIGVHLRGENDWPAPFGSVDDQMRLYTEQIEKIQLTVNGGVKTVYVSCGDSAAIQVFREKLEPLGYTVVDKSIILDDQPETVAQLEALYFDQKAIVEYQALVEAKFWMGLSMSSMSSLVAYARTVDQQEDFFTNYVFPGSTKNGLERVYPTTPAMKGNMWTELMVVNGVDIMDSFP